MLYSRTHYDNCGREGVNNPCRYVEERVKEKHVRETLTKSLLGADPESAS